MKILVVYRIPVEPFANLPEGWSYTIPEEGQFSKDEVMEMISEYDVLLANFTIPVTKDIIDRGKKLKLISNFGVGFNHIDIEYAKQKGIMVCNTPNSVCRPTAELCMALLLAASRKISLLDRKLREKKEKVWGVMSNLGVNLEGKTLGIIGLGNIGLDVARKAEAFDMKIVYHNRNHSNKKYQWLPLEELLKISDVISIHVPLTSDTQHLISVKEFALMKPGVILINTARGPIVDEQALVAALISNKISSAALDVFEFEPKITKELYDLDNVVMVPHIGTATYEGRVNMAQEAYDNIIGFAKGTPTNVVV